MIDRFSDILLFIGLIYLYSRLGRTDYVMIASFAMMFALMTSYTRARAESLIAEVQGRLHGAARADRALHDRRLHQPHGRRDVGDPACCRSSPSPTASSSPIACSNAAAERPRRDERSPLPVRMLWNAFFWTFERATWQYDVMVIAILAFVWLTPPDWIGDPMAHGHGPLGWFFN